MSNCYIVLFAIIVLGFVLYPLVTDIMREGLTNSSSTDSSSSSTGSNSTTASSNVVMYGPNNETATITKQNTVILTNLSGTQTTYAFSSTTTTNTFTMKTYVDSNGNKAVVLSNAQGAFAIQLSVSGSTTPVMYYPGSTVTADDTTATSSTTPSSQTTVPTTNSGFNTFYASNGDIARLITGGQTELMLVTYKSSGNVEIFYVNPTTGGTASSKQFFGPSGQVATYENNQITMVNSDKTSVVFTLSNPTHTTATASAASNPTSTTSTQQSAAPTTSSPEPLTTQTSLPTSNVSQTVYPTGQDGQYILKSSIVPPVCPTCPSPIVQCGGGQSKPDTSSAKQAGSSTNKSSSFANSYATFGGNGKGNCFKQAPTAYSSNYSGAGS